MIYEKTGMHVHSRLFVLLSDPAVFFQQSFPQKVWLFPVRRFREVKRPGHAGVDDRNAFPVSFALEVGTGISLMDMAVDHHGRMPGIQKRTEAFKPPVGEIILVPETADRRVGQQDIKPAGGPDIPPEPENPRFCSF